MLDVKKTLTKILNQLPRMGANYLQVGNILIQWGYGTTTSGALVTSFSKAYSSASSYRAFASGVYANAYIAYMTSVQPTSGSGMNIYMRYVSGGSMQVPANGTGVFWLTIGTTA